MGQLCTINNFQLKLPMLALQETFRWQESLQACCMGPAPGQGRPGDAGVEERSLASLSIKIEDFSLTTSLED